MSKCDYKCVHHSCLWSLLILQIWNILQKRDHVTMDVIFVLYLLKAEFASWTEVGLVSAASDQSEAMEHLHRQAGVTHAIMYLQL